MLPQQIQLMARLYMPLQEYPVWLEIIFASQNKLMRIIDKSKIIWMAVARLDYKFY